MPIYDYKCLDCQEIFEALILKNTPAPTCPACKSAKLEQQVSLFGVDSEGVRENNLKGVRAKNKAAQKDYQMEQIRHEREHHH
jgi:putative FmdB family regulatory protein